MSTNPTNAADNFEKQLEQNGKVPATIGTSVAIKGEISGEDDIIIHGYVEGQINIKQNVVIVAKTGRVQAHIYAKVIQVEGDVTGNLFASEQVVVHRSGNVKGNISSPRITIEDGARLKGSVDTDPASDSAPQKNTEVIKTASKDETVIAEGLLASTNGKRSNQPASY